MKKNNKIRKIFFWPDTHFMYEDKRAVALAKKVVKAFKPDVFVCLGDVADVYSVSSFDKDPSRKVSLKEELDYAADELEKIDACLPKGCEKVFTVGNHELRIEKYIAKNAAELHGLVRNEINVRLKSLGWKIIPYRKSYRVGELCISHDFGKAGPLSHIQGMQKFGGNIVQGHSHVLGVHYGGLLNGKKHVGMSCGWLGDPAAVDYMHSDSAHQSWMTGVGVGYIMPNGVAHLQAVPFLEDKAVVDGKVVSL